jgi:hypothetical protein
VPDVGDQPAAGHCFHRVGGFPGWPLGTQRFQRFAVFLELCFTLAEPLFHVLETLGHLLANICQFCNTLLDGSCFGLLWNFLPIGRFGLRFVSVLVWRFTYRFGHG